MNAIILAAAQAVAALWRFLGHDASLEG